MSDGAKWSYQSVGSAGSVYCYGDEDRTLKTLITPSQILKELEVKDKRIAELGGALGKTKKLFDMGLEEFLPEWMQGPINEHYKEVEEALSLFSTEKPNCPSCGHNEDMIQHDDGVWVCHNTHRMTKERKLKMSNEQAYIELSQAYDKLRQKYGDKVWKVLREFSASKVPPSDTPSDGESPPQEQSERKQ